jgi:hypothetical protein
LLIAEYVITDGSRFIYKNHAGKYVPTSTEALADIFNKKQAEGIYNNSLSKALKSVFYLKKYDEVPTEIKQTSQQDLEKTEKVMMSANIQYWLNKVSDLNGLAKDADKRRTELLNQLNEVNQELCDIEHWIEFTNLNAAQGYKAYKMLKERRIKRRSIKNELNVIDVILDKKISETVSDDIRKSVQNIDDRTYSPRILKELFDL